MSGRWVQRADPLAIETRDLVKRFRRQAGWRAFWRSEYRPALDGVSLRVPRGECFGLLGPNGAGKTTLMKILATLVLPDGGRADVNGVDVVTHGEDVRRMIGVVYGDERTFFWRLSVRENLRFYASLYRMPRRRADVRIDELLERVGLSEAADVRMHSFSTGMKQRAAVARGLLSEPEIVFMDEPTRSLDPVGAFEVHQLIREQVMADGKRTVLLATNNMSEAEAMCDRLALLNHGRVQLMGTLSEIHQTLSGYDRHRLSLSHVDHQGLVALQGVPGVLWARGVPQEDGRWSVEIAVGRETDAIPRCIRQLVADGAKVWSCAAEELSLDDIFRLAVAPVRADRRALEEMPA